jgi:hypothetical protein
MTDEKKPADPTPVTDDKAASAHKITRRRFTKAGAIAPVVMTLGSRPVWGACATSISGQQSGNDYLMYEAPGSAGYPPSWWVVSLKIWPAEYAQQKATEATAHVSVKIGNSTYNGPFTAYCVNKTLSALTGCPTTSTGYLYEALAGGDHADGAQATAAMLNAHYLGDAYGYMPSSIAEFICNGHPADVTCVLQGLNARSSEPMPNTESVVGVKLTFGEGVNATHYTADGAYYDNNDKDAKGNARLIIIYSCAII